MYVASLHIHALALGMTIWESKVIMYDPGIEDDIQS